jgi:hypothetical protein
MRLDSRESIPYAAAQRNAASLHLLEWQLTTSQLLSCFQSKAPMAGHAAKKAAAAESKASAVYLALILLLNAVYIAVKGTV